MANTAFYWWFKQTSLRTILFGLILTLLLGIGLTHGGSMTIPDLSPDNLSVVGLSAGFQLSPLLNPANISCAEYWESFSTTLGVPAFITLNVSAANSTNSAEWRPDLPAAGKYQVEAFIATPPTSINCSALRGPTQNTSQAIYTVNHSAGSTKVTINQSSLQNAWISLGVYQFAAGSNNFVSLSDANNETPLSRFVSFGALRFTPSAGQYIYYLPTIYKDYYIPTPTPGMVVIRQKQAFDSCNRPTLSQMQTWWNSSPYWIYNLYIGGISNSSCYPELLNSSYVAAARSQGWEFIPTWVGLQAPCTSFKYRFSSDPSNAFGQGIQEANQAFARAANLGLVGSTIPNTVIYYDMEAFYGADDACKLAARSFLSGWSQRLHELGARSGVYGSACYYMPDWTALSNPLDDAWIASWYKTDTNGDGEGDQYYYDPNANVWNVICLSPNVWTDHQRIRQYAGGHNETWGGVTINIDSNVTDGRVVSPGNRLAADRALTAQTASSGLEVQTIQDYELVAPDLGWALDNGKLLWTEDGGRQWKDRTPTVLEGDLIGIHYIDDQNGWLAVMNTQGMSVQIMHTQDSGQNWQVTELPFQTSLASAAETAFFDFLDANTGWVSLRLGSGSAFSLGLLFQTQDGGQTWQALSLPVGEAVNFIDAQNGWTAGGAAGGELYVTSNGGRTWQPANFIQASSGAVFYGLPEFTDPEHGVVPVTLNNGGQPRLEFYNTQDGGKTWQLSGLLPLDPQNEPGAMIPVSVPGPLTLIAADESAQQLFTFGSQGLTADRAQTTSLPEGVVDIQFISATEGWAKTVQAACTGDKSPGAANPLNCQVSEGLWQTLNGGATWTKIR